MTLKRVIDADKICANLLFLRKSASAFRRYRCQPVMSPVLKIATDDSSAKSHLNHKEHKEHKEIREKHPRLFVFISGWKTFLQWTHGWNG